MSPAERALALFERVMRASEAGDMAQVQQFLPMALAAHEMARPLNLDQLYHLAELHKAGGDHASALTVAGEILSQNPDHLLGLKAAVEAMQAMGDREGARRQAAHFVEVYDVERAKRIVEYEEHVRVLEPFLDVARQLAGG
jgi:hypothetical protein